jgi:uncharacterized membrane protein (UPF0127 family)/shikimate kinase
MRIYDPEQCRNVDLSDCFQLTAIDGWTPTVANEDVGWFVVDMQTNQSRKCELLEEPTSLKVEEAVQAYALSESLLGRLSVLSEHEDLDDWMGLNIKDCPDVTLPIRVALAKGQAEGYTLDQIRFCLNSRHELPDDAFQVVEGLDDADITSLAEGVEDKHILKAMFVMGAGASGKSKVGDEMFAGLGMKFINQDKHLTRFFKEADIPLSEIGSDYGLFKKAQALGRKELKHYAQQRLGLVIDMTGWDFKRIERPVNRLRALGYDCYAVLVHASLEKSQKRNLDRERKVPDYYVATAHRGLWANFPRYSRLFGKEQTFLIRNEDDIEQDVWDREIGPKLRNAAMKILAKPVKNKNGQKWISRALQAKGVKPQIEAEVFPTHLPFTEETLDEALAGEAVWYANLHRQQKGIFYRGAKAVGRDKGLGWGALGKGLYLTWQKGMAKFFADRGNGEVFTYKVAPRLKILDYSSKEMAEIKEQMGFKPWEYSDDPMYANVITNAVKKLGYDGVVSDNPAEGLVLFDGKKAELASDIGEDDLTEALDKPYEWKWKSQNTNQNIHQMGRQWVAGAKIPAEDSPRGWIYLDVIFPHHFKGSWFDISFELDGEWEEWAVQKKPDNPMRVLSTAWAVIQDWLKKTKPDSFTFTTKGASKVKLFDRWAKMIAAKGYEFTKGKAGNMMSSPKDRDLPPAKRRKASRGVGVKWSFRRKGAKPTVFEDQAELRKGTLVLPKNNASFLVELAETPEQIAKGMMFRETLPADGGMLFLMPERGQHSMFMRNTPLPLDMVFLDGDQIVHIVTDTTPYSEALHTNEAPASMVLELNAGTAKKHQMAVGDTVIVGIPDGKQATR